MRYTIELVDPVEPRVAIHVETRGDADGTSELTLDEGWAGIAESGKDLELVEARGRAGVLASERVNASTWRVSHAPGEALALVFELRPTRHRANPGPPEYYLPILEPGLLHLLGAQALPAPTHLAFGDARPISLAWSGFAESGWRTISSYGEGAGEVRVDASLDSFRHALFLAGALRLAPLDVHGRPLWVSLFGTWKFGDAELTALARRVAHELFHQWNGQTISLQQPEELGYWFSEGFTVFFARRLLLENGLMTRERWLDSWNAKLAGFAANAERHAPAERVHEAFWSDSNVGSLPYQRGDVIALFVDHAIRARSGGARSLDDLMRALVARSRGGGGPFSCDDLVAAIGEFGGDDCARAVRAWALGGVEPALARDLAGPGYELVPAELATFDTGFDHQATLRDGVVSGVKPGGAAERAGLADGMRIASWSVTYGRADVPVQVSVRDGGAERKISYLPQGAAVRGYRLAASQR